MTRLKELEGHHGTSALKAQQILAKGFEPGKGRHGMGVYFWRKNNFSIRLATDWCDQQRRAGVYGQDEVRVAVLEATLKVMEQQFLDLTRPEWQDIIHDVHGRIKAEQSRHVDEGQLPQSERKRDEELLALAYEWVLTRAEQELATEVGILQVQTSAPRTGPGQPGWWNQRIGLPFCYVVRDNSCIIGVQLVNLEDIP